MKYLRFNKNTYGEIDYEHNIYSHPESHDCKILISLEKQVSYEFDMVVVFQHNDGAIRWGEDKGCSCPSPFQECESFEDLHKLPETLEEFRQAVHRLKHYKEDKDGKIPSEYDYEREEYPSLTDRLEFIRDVEKLIR